MRAALVRSLQRKRHTEPRATPTRRRATTATTTTKKSINNLKTTITTMNWTPSAPTTGAAVIRLRSARGRIPGVGNCRRTKVPPPAELHQREDKTLALVCPLPDLVTKPRHTCSLRSRFRNPLPSLLMWLLHFCPTLAIFPSFTLSC